MLEPLNQFICDNCGGIIDGVENGFVEWLVEPETSLNYNFTIVHAPQNPGDTLGCLQHQPQSSYIHLEYLMSDEGLIQILWFLDTGLYYAPAYQGPKVKDMREFVELVRRLKLPYYEEARNYIFDTPDFDHGDELTMYSALNLRALIETNS
jgi:hypothetical protein